MEGQEHRSPVRLHLEQLSQRRRPQSRVQGGELIAGRPNNGLPS
jgi:hypothetical protein